MNTEKNVLKKSGVESTMNEMKFYIRSGYQCCKDKTHQNIEYK